MAIIANVRPLVKGIPVTPTKLTATPDSVLNPSGRCFLVLTATAAADVTVSAKAQPETLSLADFTVTFTAAGTMVLGPFLPAIFNSVGNTFDVKASADDKVTAFVINT